MTYRYDIDGLRAVAVLAVLFFHLSLPLDFHPVNGGFLGVDVFFVISGYLISGQIISAIKTETFSAARFFKNRLLRLFPALAIVVIGTVLYSFWAFPPSEVEAVGQSAIYSLLSAANILFWLQSGYFDADALTKPLLHYWSLSVEEQFYLIWPALLLFAARFKIKAAATLSVVIILSFALCIFMSSHAPFANFFLMPTRMWEFAVGGLVWIYRPQIIPKLPKAAHAILFVGGLGVLLSSFYVFNEGMKFPSYSAWIPIASTMAILLSGPNFLKNLLFENPLMRGIGNISYSLYLVHWPLIVFFIYQHTGDFTLLHAGLLLAASLILASLIYVCIETPLRNLKSKTSFSQAFAGTSAAIILCIFPLSHIWKSADFIAHSVEPELASLQENIAQASVNRRVELKRLIRNNAKAEKRAKIAILGDSHADDVFIALSHGFPDTDFKRVIANGCRPIIDFIHPDWTEKQKQRCKAYSPILTEFIENDPRVKTVIIEANWTERSLAALQPTIDRLHESGRRVIVMQPRVQVIGTATRVASQAKSIEDFTEKSEKSANHIRTRTLTDMLAELNHIEIFEIVKFQCPSQCSNMVPNSTMPIIYDNAHMTIEGSRYLGGEIAKQHPSFFKN